jgi:peptidoglycan/LPS O-acetylase OafA/YrhL
VSIKYFDNLAGVRGMAAAVVLLSHLVQIHFLRFIGLGTSIYYISSTASKYAVLIFFIISGYLIAHSLEENIKRNGKIIFLEYVAARIARIYPTFLYAIGISLLAFLVMDIFSLPGRSGALRLSTDIYAAREFVHLNLKEILQAILMLQGMLEINGPLWSLYIEVKLYVLYACALAMLNDRRIMSMLILGLISYFIILAGTKFNPEFFYFSAFWLMGAVAYYLDESAKEKINYYSKPMRLILCVLLFIIVVLVEILKTDEKYWMLILDIILAVIFSYGLFKLRISVPNYRRLTDCSYSLYLTHFPVLLLFQSLLIKMGNVSFGLVIGIVFASITLTALVALVGGVIEAKKIILQIWLLKMAKRVYWLRMPG